MKYNLPNDFISKVENSFSLTKSTWFQTGGKTDIYCHIFDEKDLKFILNQTPEEIPIFILGAGGVVPSIILALKRSGVAKITLSNRTKKKAENLKKIHSDLEVIDWGQTPDFNMIINATSLGLKNDDQIKLDYADIGPNKLFYDVIYNPGQTNFLLKAKQFGNQIENGKMMFIYQAQLAFKIWHNILPKIDKKLLDL